MTRVKYSFTKMTISEFESWIRLIKIQRVILYIQQHHTWVPNYSSFSGDNHFELQFTMRNYHVQNNGWADIGQHFTTFPDGSILSGRSLEKDPAGIFGCNSNSICIENIGNFDKGRDEMTSFQRDTIIKLTAALCRKFSISVSSDKIVYHHWFNPVTGERDDGFSENNKSCPGTDFFGGNTVPDCQENFLPLISQVLSGI